MSGEAAARSEIDLPGAQEELVEAIKATGKPFVVVLFNGRPLTIGDVAADSPAILEAWFPGVQAGNAVADVLFGKVNPGGKLPVSFPRRVGQVPIYYNHEPTGPAVRRDAEVRVALPRPGQLRAAVPVRVRPELHDVRRREPAAELVDGRAARAHPRHRRRDQHRSTSRATRSCSSTSTTPSRASRSRSAGCAGSSGSRSSRGRRRRSRSTLDASDFGFYDNRGQVRGRAGPDRRLRGRQLRRAGDRVVHGPLGRRSSAGIPPPSGTRAAGGQGPNQLSRAPSSVTTEPESAAPSGEQQSATSQACSSSRPSRWSGIVRPRCAPDHLGVLAQRRRVEVAGRDRDDGDPVLRPRVAPARACSPPPRPGRR